MGRRETYEAELPDGVLVLTCGVDTQDDRLEYEVLGHGRWGEKWGIRRPYGQAGHRGCLAGLRGCDRPSIQLCQWTKAKNLYYIR